MGTFKDGKAEFSTDEVNAFKFRMDPKKLPKKFEEAIVLGCMKPEMDDFLRLKTKANSKNISNVYKNYTSIPVADAVGDGEFKICIKKKDAHTFCNEMLKIKNKKKRKIKTFEKKYKFDTNKGSKVLYRIKEHRGCDRKRTSQYRIRL